MNEPLDRAKDEFFAEVQELIESLSRDLFALDASLSKGSADPSVVNDAFRAVHTLKGLAGLFGASRLGRLSHDLEDLLGELRLGRRLLSKPVVDLLFQALELYGRLLQLEKNEEENPADGMDARLAEVTAFVRGHSLQHPSDTPIPDRYHLDQGLLSVLTEYEEHRLKTNLQNGFLLYRVHVTFRLTTIDQDLEEVKTRLKALGEIITYLPTGGGQDAENIDLEILLASHGTREQIANELGSGGRVEEAARQATIAPPPPPLGAMAAEAETRSMNILTTTDSISRPPRSFHRSPTPNPATSELPLALRTGRPEIVSSLRSVSQTVRVDIRKLDHLMNLVGELAIVRSALTRTTEKVRDNPALRELGGELHRLQRGFERHLGAMQDGILEVRMVPLGQIFDKLGRVVRQASRESAKRINLVITGAETELDKLIVEELSDPLVHLVRNAVDHGIETDVERKNAGKPETGTIAINAFQKGSHVILEIEDDGRGMDEKALVAVALRQGFLSEQEAREIGRREAFGLIFRPGFTTKTSPDMLAGRGVGMDIVKTNIGRLSGLIDVQSEPGIGTKLTVTLPITLAILNVLITEVHGQVFALPLSSVQEALVFDETQVRFVDGWETMTVRGATLPLLHLGRFFALAPDTSRPGRGFVVVIAAGPRRLGLIVSHLEGQQDIVIKPLGASLAHVRGFAGAAELGDQRIGLVLDAPAILEEVLVGLENVKEPTTRAAL